MSKPRHGKLNALYFAATYELVQLRIPPDMQREMKDYPEENWSALMREAISIRLKQLSSQRMFEAASAEHRKVDPQPE